MGRENDPGDGELVELVVVMPALNEAASLAESLRALQPLRRRGTWMAQNRRRLRELALRWHEGKMLWDVGRPEDLNRLAALEMSR